MIHRLLAVWDRFWFEPTPASALGVCRLLFYGALLAFFVFEDYSGWADVSRAFWRPIWLFSALGLPVLSSDALHAAQIVWRLSLLLAAVGLFTRASTIVAFVLGAYLLGLPHNFGQTYHFDALLVFVLAAMAAARSGDAWSVDSLIRAARHPGAAPLPRSGVYQWPIRFVWVAMALVFVAAGLSKLRHAGGEWIASDTMSIVLLRAHYHVSDADPIGRVGLALANWPFAAQAIALVTIVVETAFPLALVSRTARKVLVPSAALMLLGIRVLMGPTFGVFLVCNLFWVPWPRVGAYFRRRAAALPRPAVIYDGACGLCRPTVAVIRRLDVLGRVDVYDCAYDWARTAAQYPALDRGECLSQMHVMDGSGRVFTGFDAYRRLATVLPAGWPFAPLARLPGVRWIGTRIYDAIAATRRRGACRIVPPSRKRPCGESPVPGGDPDGSHYVRSARL